MAFSCGRLQCGPRPGWRAGLFGAFALTVACRHLAPAAYVDEPALTVLLAVPASPDSTVKLARFAMGAIGGSAQLPSVQATSTIVSTHYFRPSRRGETEVAILAAIGRKVADPLMPLTIVEVRGWALETPVLPVLPARGRAATAASLVASLPADRPRPITAADTTDWSSLQFVVEAFQKHGARRIR